MKKLSFIFIVPGKDNNNCTGDQLKILAITFSRYILSSYYIDEDKHIKFSPIKLRMRAMVSLYLVLICQRREQ